MTTIPRFARRAFPGFRRNGGRWVGSSGHSERGQSVVEFALIVPLLLFLMLGVVDFGRGVGAYVALSHAAREGARAGIYTAATDSEIRNTVKAQAGLLGNVPDENIIISPNSPCQSGDTLQVVVNHEFSAVTPLFNVFWDGDTLTMTAVARMKVE
jgi:Flp pilus assembly protein TadG